ncbi:MAG TPA: 2Fe-2S iron-sulfur cluster-binding protein [Myxococcales bacterium]|nr:2Fe-2S iron-sulfur cluster-binding protein [Myxococcales bacterium]
MPRIFLDGEPVDAEPSDTVAAALLRRGVTTFTRSIKYHRPRGPFCLAGSCGQCLMRIDGVPSLPACRIPAREGMLCERQNGPLGVEKDLFRASDFLFPEGLDHHHLLVRSRLLGRVALEVARRLAGLGELPERARPAAQGECRTVRLAIVGAGPAGLAAARAAGPGALVIEREPQPGGAARLGLVEMPPVPAGVELLLEAECVGLYRNDAQGNGNALLALRHRGRLLAVTAERVIVATGGASQPLPFPGSDRPGVYAARGLLGLPLRVGKRLALVGDGEEARRCGEALGRRGYEIVQAKDPVRALGNPVRAVDLESGERLRCDAVAIALPPAPLHDLATSAGALARFDGNGFPVQTDAEGGTGVGWLFAAGTVAGKPAAPSGEAAGKAACR